MKTYFESNPKKLRFLKKKTYSGKSAMDYGFYNQKAEGLFRKRQGRRFNTQIIVMASLQICRPKGYGLI